MGSSDGLKIKKTKDAVRNAGKYFTGTSARAPAATPRSDEPEANGKKGYLVVISAKHFPCNPRDSGFPLTDGSL